MDSTFMYEAVVTGDTDVISAFTSDGRIARYDLVILDDPKQALPPYDAVLLVSPRRAEDEALRRALAPLIGAIDVKLMQETNLLADRAADKRTPDEAARWLWDKISGQPAR
jgi:osmoprotectant transport system permease protein